MNIDFKKVTPMMRQYLETKEEYKDCILMFRLGDFYEMFFEDALLASDVLEIALTRKSCGLQEKAPMCGVPHHSAESYISRLVEAGYKVAIAEQMEDPREVKGIVKREVVRIVTPGTLLDESFLDNKSNNYLLVAIKNDDIVSLAYIDISTGEFMATQSDMIRVTDEILRIGPSEALLSSDIQEILSKSDINMLSQDLGDYSSKYTTKNSLDILKNYFTNEQINNINTEDRDGIIVAMAVCLDYISTTQKQIAGNINSFRMYTLNDFMVLDNFTRMNLELTETIRGSKKKGSLLSVLDKTSTAMGARLLRKHIEEPLISKSKIENRLDVIESLFNDYPLNMDVSYTLKHIYDIERISAKIAYEKVNPKELNSLKESLRYLPALRSILMDSDSSSIISLVDNMDTLEDIFDIIDTTILEEPKMSIREGNIINDNVSGELDELRDIYKNGAVIISNIEAREKEKLNTKNLKIGYNKVFGYYIEITKAQLIQINLPEEYIRKQTLVNAERFITPELKEIEDKIINAESRIKDLEYDIFVKLREKLRENIFRIQETARTIALIDVFSSHALVAMENEYIRPTISDDDEFYIKEGRHPVIEAITGREKFIPNDTFFDRKVSLINIITGPNMSGKSTYMRQSALISLMAHIGSFVPAKEAKIPILDRIFTRVGASDDLAHGQSTFMVEMAEVSHILSNATDKSLIILDEIGRGTSTYDGISLAWSIVEYIHENIKAKTLFATHYHELTDMDTEYDNVKNYSVEVKEDGEDVVFLRNIIEGPADRSYGIYVAKLARIPDEIIKRADEILLSLEKTHNKNTDIIKSGSEYKSKVKKYNKGTKNADKCAGNQNIEMDRVDKEEQDTSLNEIVSTLKNLDITRITPLEAMNILNELNTMALE